MSEPLLKVRLGARYGKTEVLKDVHFDLAQGEALGLIGTSGAGKSTLVLALLGLLPWRGGKTSGEVIFEGVNLLNLRENEARQFRGRRFALVPQSPTAALNPALTLRAHFEEAWRAHKPASHSQLADRLAEVLPQVQLPTEPSFLARKPGQISIGQGQRILIALALLHRPSLLIADEPTSALDPVTQAEIVRLLRTLAGAGTALLYISHDLLSVLQLCDRVAVLADGTIAELLPVGELSRHARHPATRALLGALPVPPEQLLPAHVTETRNANEPSPAFGAKPIRPPHEMGQKPRSQLSPVSFFSR